jgi:hypothetical protein
MEDLMGEIITEFSKIEKVVGSDFHNMYIFKTIIDSARTYRKEYVQKETRYDAVSYFKEDVLKCIDSIASFCNPKINWEKLLCSLLCISKCIENFCNEKLRKLLSVKKSDYNNMLIKTPSEIYEAIEANIPSHFFFDEQTQVYVWDVIKQRSYKINVDGALINTLNETHPYERGTILYEKIASEDY